MEWLANNIGTVIIVLVLAAAVAGIILGMIRDRKKGRPACGGCGGNCAACGLCSASKSPGQTPGENKNS